MKKLTTKSKSRIKHECERESVLAFVEQIVISLARGVPLSVADRSKYNRIVRFIKEAK